MKTSLFEIFKVGIGPSSSHTVGPMRAAEDFVAMLGARSILLSAAPRGSRDMQSRYKETSLGGLALNVIEC